MADIRFEWDERKDVANQRKHGVSFEEAASVFYDEEALLMVDTDHSSREDRFVLIGLSFRPRLLVVSHTYRQREDVIRIISARQPDRRERSQYIEQWNL